MNYVTQEMHALWEIIETVPVLYAYAHFVRIIARLLFENEI